METARSEPLTDDDLALLAEIKTDPKGAARRMRSLKKQVGSQNKKIGSQNKQIRSLKKQLAIIEEKRRLDRLKRFGASADRGEHQYRLFDEAEAHENDAADDEAGETDDISTVEVAAHIKRKAKRKPLPKDLPRVAIDHELTADERRCECGSELKPIGVQTSEQLDVIPAQAYVIEHRRHSYRCSCCDAPPVAASLPAQPFPKSIASPGLLAHVATAKYADGLPLYRQSAMFKRHGIDLPRQTMAGHMVKMGQLTAPLIEALHQSIAGYDVVQVDETPVQVLNEPDKTAQSKSYMWVMRGGPPGQPGVLYHYAPGRGGAVAKHLLKDFKGYLQTDGYAGYRDVCRSEHVTGVGCLAHARRKFTDALKAMSKQAQKKKNAKVHKALSLIEQLYQIERGQKNATPEERLSVRQAKARPILDRFKAWLDRQSIPPQSLLGKAIHYTLTEWPRLIVYVDDGRINIDNNLVENAIRPFAIGRKAWLFSATQDGATASANLYSLVASARANGHNEYAYLKYVFTHLPAANTEEDVAALLPWKLAKQDLQSMLNVPEVSTT